MTAAQAGRQEREPHAQVRVEQWRDVRTGCARPLSETTRTCACRMAAYPEICEQLFAAACDRGLTPHTQVVAPGDGGNGLWEEMAVQFVRFQYILDHRHLESHFYETAEVLTIETARWALWVKAHMNRSKNRLHDLATD
jgi:hypothetical protein